LINTPILPSSVSAIKSTSQLNEFEYSAPFISVKILTKNFTAFLDTGSPISVIGNLVINHMKRHKLNFNPCSKRINFLKGSFTCHYSIEIEISYDIGVRLQKLYLVPGTINSVLLGRDFLGPSNISVHVSLGGWSLTNPHQTIIPFIENTKRLYPQMDIILSAENEIDSISSIPIPLMFNQLPSGACGTEELQSNACVLNEIQKQKHLMDDGVLKEFDLIDLEDIDYHNPEYHNPASVLANWDYLETSDSSTTDSLNIPLYPEKENSVLVASDLSEDQLVKLRACLEEFQSMFTDKPGLCTLYKHSINTGDAKPIKCRNFPMTPGKRKVFDETFDELLKYDIIEPSQSPWSSNGFVVTNNDNSLRFVLNYKPINAVTKSDVYPINRIDEMLAHLGSSNYMSTYDLSKGFFQIEMNDEGKEKTAFISHRGLWQFKRMPMGLKNSPATFQRMVDNVLGDNKWLIVLVYFDDIMVFSTTFEKHLEDNRTVLSKLKSAGLTIKPSKVQLCRKKLNFLGHVIDSGKCYPNPKKIECLMNYPRPKRVKEIQMFLGLVGFYRKFIPEFSIKARPLHMLLKKNVKFKWSDETQESFDFLKNALSRVSELYLPNLNGTFIIQSDASISGLGAILSQEREGVRFPIWFASRSLRGAEIRYSITELELLAALWAIEKFRGYIEYTHFVLETDHQALSWLYKIKDPAGRIARWYMTFQMYDFEIRYRPGTSACMKAPDALSRIPELMCFITESPLDRLDLISKQNEDSVLSKVKSVIRNFFNSIPKSDIEKYKRRASKCSISSDGLLMRYVGPRNKPWEDERLYWRVWIPQSLRHEVLEIFHSHLTAGHLGIMKTFGKIEQRMYWENMRRDVVKFVKSCLVCQESKTSKLPLVPGSSLTPEGPWELIATDSMGPFPKGKIKTNIC